MNISRSEQSAIKHNLEQYQIDRARFEKQRTEDYTKKIEERRFDQIVAERVARNLRLDLDKGRNIDIEC
jgi:tRNA/tmRNA/rRNA uracil-C5-methylase (TrmA/RlmC/RlmD family)